MTNNFIFVDIDGPLLPGKSQLFQQNREFLKAYNSGVRAPELFVEHPPMFDEWSVRAHNLLARYGNAKIVLVTNWRVWCDLDNLKDMLHQQGLEFEYADPASCIKRGISSERYHDIATHMEDCLPDNSRVLIIDDASLQPLNLFYRLEGETGERDKENQYYGPEHSDDQTIVVSEDRDIRARWLKVDYADGLGYRQWRLGAKFLGVDWEKLDFEEFGIVPLTEEEKAQRQRDLEFLASSI